ncbi:MAG: SusC/RagA family TonB-linked outer membrane protein [Williamsia sp.]|nr:SusC/RagA family TonB-linked outer membrane protein [Williamsia sp.]
MKTIPPLKRTVLCTLAGCLILVSTSFAQLITISKKNASLQDLLMEVYKQSGYYFYCNSDLLGKAKKVDINVREASLEDVLKICFKDQSLGYSIDNKVIVVKEKKVLQNGSNSYIRIKGRVLNEQGEPIAGTTITVIGKGISVVTDANGEFVLPETEGNSTIIVSNVGYETLEVTIANRKELLIKLTVLVGKLDEVQIIGYGTTTKRLNTGNVTTVTNQEISRQPVSNPLQALQGRVPGMFIQSNGGAPGSNLNIQVRGLNSITAGNGPLYIINGVPFTGTTLDLITPSSTTATIGGLSPLNNINPADIESVEILKDADATAIYGSRGANGVVLITTKKGKAGRTKVTVNAYNGIGKVAHFVEMLDINRYRQLRRMAFVNDKITPTAANAPDLLVWDTTQNTDWQKALIGGKAQINEEQLTLSGGSDNTRFIVGGSYRRNGTVFPGDIGDNRGTGYLNLDHTSLNKKLHAEISVNYSVDVNNLIGDPTPFSNLPPNYPVYTPAGKLNWRPGVYFNEPYSLFQQKFSNKTNVLLSNGVFRYQVAGGLNCKVSLGYTQSDLNQTQLLPSTASNPLFNFLGSSYFGDNHVGTWIAEPQITYSKSLSIGNIDVLAGATWQQSLTQQKLIYASNYSSDALLENIASAGNYSFLTNNFIRYRYNSFFGKATYNFENKYIVNGSFRRDGSSRFGPGRQFGNFGAVGAAWIFSGENALKKYRTFLSYGKLRASYGVTGNDQIPDYQYLSTYTGTTVYQIPGLRAARLANPDYSWETNKKLEGALELGFVKDRILFSAAYYLNRSGNQLVNYPLPTQTGFGSYVSNLNALIQNSGWEISFSSINVKGDNINWTTTFNITLPKNKLIDFPGLAGTSYGSANLVKGQSLNLAWGFHYLGVDPQTGLSKVATANGGNTISPAYPDDYIHFGTLLPSYYGGFGNVVSVKDFEVSVFFQFAKKIAQTIRSAWGAGAAGTIYNQEAGVWNKIWKQAGDAVILPKPATNYYPYSYLYTASDAGAYEDASYVKLTNLSLNYRLSGNWLNRAHIENFKVFFQAQNLFTITKYSGFDPEAAGAAVLPNLRVLTAGIHCEL